MFTPQNRCALVMGFCVLVGGAAGCSPVTRPVVHSTLLRLADLGVTAAMPEPNTVVAVETQPSIGRFPAGVSVARVKIEESPGGPPGLVIDSLTDPEALYWNELFDSVGKIREVTVIDPQSVPQRYVTVPQLLASSRRQKCRLCVVYGQNEVAHNVSRVVGALYDADTNELVAVIFAEQIVDPQEKTPPPADYPKGDERHKDAHWLVARRFEQLVRGFVLELIERDREPGAPAAPAPRPAGPAPAGR